MLSTLKHSSKFDYNLPALWLRPLKCAVCNDEFVLRVKAPRRPLLMKCFHSVCERCCSGSRPIHLTCNLCNEVTRIDKNQLIREVLPMDYFVMGLVNYMEFNLQYDVSMLDAFSFNDKRNSREKYTLQECSECNDVLTNHFCAQCNVPYCPGCFDQVHKQGKALQRHHLSQYDHRGKMSIKFDQVKRCRRHNNFINKYCCDCQQAMCVLCVMDGHGRHRVSSLIEENQKLLSQIASLIESVKTAKEANKIAQKDAKFVAKRYEDYATDAINDISQYFIHLHGVLQSIEREVQCKVRNSAVQILSEVRRVQTSLKTGQETFDEILHTLEEAITHPPANVTVSKVLEKANSVLESTACNVEFGGVNTNPFEFVKLRQHPIIFPSLYELNIHAGEFRSTVFTYLGERSSEISLESQPDTQMMKSASETINRNRNMSTSVQEKNVTTLPNAGGGGNKRNKRNRAATGKMGRGPTTTDTQSMNSSEKDANPTASNISLFSTTTSTTPTMQKVHVSYIQNPENIFVQPQKFIMNKAEYEELIREELTYAPTPNYIEEGHVYLVFNAATQLWYRGEVVTAGEINKVFLVDYGNTITVPKQRFRTMTETLKCMPPGAMKCALYGIRPVRNEWSDKAKSLMSDIIKDNAVSMVMYKEDTICQVDLITTHLTYPTSVRNALIFAELAVDDLNLSLEMQKRVKDLSNVRKSLLTPPTSKFYKNVFKEGESFRALILKVTDPHDFYAIKFDHNGVMDSLYEDLNKDYREDQEKLFTPLANTPCAVCLNNSWFRGRITKVESKSNIDVWLVDKADFQRVSYTHLRVLLPKYLQINEYAFHCSLTDIEPLQKFGYIWTPSAIAEFVRITQNPVLQIIVQHTQNFLHRVCLYIIKKNVDINVNALLVKYQHANSTGTESQYVEHPKLNEFVKPDDDIQNEINLMELTLNETRKGSASGRTKVKLSHIVSPGEFYLRLGESQIGVSKLHEEIQVSMMRKGEFSKPSTSDAANRNGDDDDIEQKDNDSVESRWEVGNYCLARLDLKKDCSMQWYRARIKDTEAEDDQIKYSVFLRDYGLTFNGVLSENLAPIPALFSRVCDGAIKCHLACIQPTGGLETWSASSIDEFSAVAIRFAELAASIQGPSKKGSISTVLWGLKQECPDPLAPAINKWVNINRYLCNSGLAHLVEKFTPITEENALSPELLDGEKSFNQWLRQLNKTVDHTIKEDTAISILKHSDDSDISEEEAYLDEDGKDFETWLPAKEITKTVFVGIPTFVDDGGVIYLYDASQKKVFNNISVVVNKVVQKMKAPASSDSFWYKDQPCLAQFSVDGKFYRAIVKETKPDRRVSVEFVDFGNRQDCSTKDLRKQITLSQIPIQINRYRLEGILPPEGSLKFSSTGMDFLYAHIIGKECAIRVSTAPSTDGIKLCNIKCGGVDMADLMIEAGYARKAHPPSAKFLDAIMSSRLSSPTTKNASKISSKNDGSKSENATLTPVKNQPIRNEIDSDDSATAAEKDNQVEEEEEDVAFAPKLGREYEDMFDKIDLTNVNLSVRNSDNDSDYILNEGKNTYAPMHCSINLKEAFDLESDDDQDKRKPIFDESDEERVGLLEQRQLDTTPSSFDPREISTSSKLPTKLPKSSDPFHVPKLPANLKSFSCEVSFILDVTTIAIFPHLRDHMKITEEVSKEMQTAASLAPNLKTFEPNTPCLAMFSEDKLWYRGMVRGYNADDNTFDVVFVDFFNAEWVPAKKVRMCPDDIVEVPLRNLIVRLAGVRRNHRWRTADIKRRFSELVQDRRVFVRIVDHDGCVPLVEFYEDDDTDELLYEPMLAERFYLKQ